MAFCLQWTTKRSLTSGLWDWTGWDCRYSSLLFSSDASLKFRFDQLNVCCSLCPFALGLHKREQGRTSPEGLSRPGEGDEHDRVSHQDGGQPGGDAAGDIRSVHPLVGLFLFLFSPLFLFSSRNSWSLFPSFYPRVFEKMFTQSSEEMTMKRYLMSFPSVCSHFSQCGHFLCPEEVSVQLSADQAIYNQLRSSHMAWWITEAISYWLIWLN